MPLPENAEKKKEDGKKILKQIYQNMESKGETITTDDGGDVGEEV
jgi:hypothetical protein